MCNMEPVPIDEILPDPHQRDLHPDAEADVDAFLRIDAEEVDHRPVLIEPFVRQGDMVMITGAPGQGKSTLIADLITACCLPQEFANANHLLGGAMRVDRTVLGGGRRIVILDNENDPAEWNELVEATVRARGLEMDHPAVEWMLAGVRWRRCHDYNWDDLNQVDGEIQRLLDACEALNTAVLVLDSLHNMFRKDLNSAEWVNRGLDVLRQQAKARGITTIALVHTSRDFKDKLARNKYLPAYSGQQEKCADTILGMQRRAKEGLLRMILVKRRAAKWNPEGSSAEVLLSPTHGGYTDCLQGWAFTDPKDGQNAMRGLSQRHGELLASLDGRSVFTQADLPAKKRARVEATAALLRAGTIEVVSGKGRKGDPYTYKVTEIGKSVIEYLRTRPDLLP